MKFALLFGAVLTFHWGALLLGTNNQVPGVMFCIVSGLMGGALLAMVRDGAA